MTASKQEKYSEMNSSMFDSRIRVNKANKIVSIIKNCLGPAKMRESICLDIGGSTGYLANSLAAHVKTITVIDIDKQALLFGKKNNAVPNINYKLGDAMAMPIRSESIDIVICNHVYEHVPNSLVLVDEIWRILKKGGICYFAAANKYCLLEPHYRLPFLSWVPKKVADWYIKLALGKNHYYENLLSYYGLRKLLNRFTICDFTLQIIKHPQQFLASDIIKRDSIYSKIAKLPPLYLKILEPLIPTYIFVLSKK